MPSLGFFDSKIREMAKFRHETLVSVVSIGSVDMHSVHECAQFGRCYASVLVTSGARLH